MYEIFSRSISGCRPVPSSLPEPLGRKPRISRIKAERIRKHQIEFGAFLFRRVIIFSKGKRTIKDTLYKKVIIVMFGSAFIGILIDRSHSNSKGEIGNWYILWLLAENFHGWTQGKERNINSWFFHWEKKKTVSTISTWINHTNNHIMFYYLSLILTSFFL